MATDLTRPMPLHGGGGYPYSGTVGRAGRRPAAGEDVDGRGSFGPVLVVLAVISFLAVSACIAGRLCGRRPSSGERKRESGRGAAAADAAEKGFAVTTAAQRPAAVMRPLASSRATVHDVDEDDDVFEIKLRAPVKPTAAAAGWQAGGGGGRAPPAPPPPAVPIGVPPQYAAAVAAGFRMVPPATSGGTAARHAHPHALGRGNGGAPLFHGKQSR